MFPRKPVDVCLCGLVCSNHENKECNGFICSLFPAPAGAPQNVTSTTLNDTAIQVQWEEVPEIDRNGIIISYEVRIFPAQFQNVSYVNVSGSELALVVDELEEFVEYSFTVRTYTSVGPGPFSDVTTSTTDEAKPYIKHPQCYCHISAVGGGA